MAWMSSGTGRGDGLRPKLLGPPAWMSRGGSEAQADAYAYDHPDQTTAGPSVNTLPKSYIQYVLFPTRMVNPVCTLLCRQVALHHSSCVFFGGVRFLDSLDIANSGNVVSGFFFSF